MRNFLLSIVFLGIAGFVGMTLYEKWRAGEWLSDSDSVEPVIEEAVEKVVYSYPMDVEIESIDGRELSIKLIARNDTHIQFDRHTDQQRFVYPIAELVTASKQLIENFPNYGLVDAGEHIGEKGIEFGDAYVEQLREAIRRIDEKVVALHLEFGQTDSKTAKRTIARKLEDLQRDKNSLVAKIAERN
ncbi:MAG: hypothetical protein ACSHX8_08685 [Opitutaceae bacterium]